MVEKTEKGRSVARTDRAQFLGMVRNNLGEQFAAVQGDAWVDHIAIPSRAADAEAFLETFGDSFTLVGRFLALPPESLPGASWVDDGPDSSDSCWPFLRDYLLPAAEQRLNHVGALVHLSADRPGWRDGVIVPAG